ncbi:MAG: hypothetical protein LUM44_04105 [Pyrinomonadaceae bacterium]|nr:hypothetical protein [Pyrinomonadaceae bacterium]
MAQNIGKKTANSSKPLPQKQDAVKFTAAFISLLEETKDLNLIPKSYFVDDFTARFAKEPPIDINIEAKIFKKLDETRRFEFNSTFFNLGYLSLMYAFGKVEVETRGKASLETIEDNDIEAVKNLFPPQIIAMIEKSETLNSYFLKTENGIGYNTDFKIKDGKTFDKFLADSNKITEAQRAFLNERSSPEKARYTKTISQLRKMTNWTKNKTCGKDCEGFPTQTRYYELRYYPLYFKIVREKGNYKIFELTIGAVD